MLQVMPCASRTRLVVLARVRAALVGVMQQAGVRTAALQRHLERLDRQVPIVDRADGPADDEPREQIEDRREVELAAAADDELRRVADPALIRAAAPRTADRADWPRPAGRDRSSSCTLNRLPRPRLQPVFLHQANDALPADALVLLDQILVNARAAVPLPARVERRAHQHLQAAIVAGVRRLRSALPGVEAAARHAADTDRGS